ncbi:TniQ family protein [Afipia felis]
MHPTPLPLWVVPAEDEPAHGILIRLAERNGIESPGRVSSLTGLTVHDLRNGVGLDRLAAVIRCDHAELSKSTPVISKGGLSVRGEHIDSKHPIKTSIRRLCPECIIESPHHRFWFDLEFVSTCPTHARNLVHVCSCGRDLSWDDVRIAKCRHCDDGDVALIPKTPADPNIMEMDRWVLGRLGVGKPEPFPLLDKADICRAQHIIGIIGILEIRGYDERWLRPRDFDEPEAVVRARGFRVLKQGRLGEILDRVYESFRSSRSDMPETIKNAYGWFGDWVEDLRPESFAGYFGEILVANAAQKFQIKEKELRRVLPSR